MVGRLLGYLMICELAEALLASRSAIAGAVNVLEQLGLIRRSRAAGERMDRVAVDRTSRRAFGFDTAEYQEQAELAREGLAVLGEASPQRRAVLLEVAAFADWLISRLPEWEKDWNAPARSSTGPHVARPVRRGAKRGLMTIHRGPAIRAQGVRKSFGDHIVLDQVDLEVAEGSVFALLGPNGAGKTTMVRILSTLITADAGDIRVAGCDVATNPDGVRAAIGVTGQFSAVDNLLTGQENLRLMADLRHIGRERGRQRAAELLDQFDLADAAHKPLSTYSGGMRRRLDLAMTLVGDPRVIFLDEPTAGLDPRSRRTMWQIIAELVAGGVTILLTTQYLEEADQLAGRNAVLDHGRVVAHGTSAELKSRVPGGQLGTGLAMHGSAHPDRHACLTYVVPGILIMTVASAALGTAISIAMDMTTGIIDRFRTMAITRAAVLTGHVVGTLLQSLAVLALVIGVALAIGFRSNANALQWLAAIGVLVLFAIALIWLSTALGLAANSVETASNTPMFLTLLPFLSSGFVPTSTLPAGLRQFAEYQPFTPVTQTLRGLLIGGPVISHALAAIAWSAGIAATSYLWSLRLYNRRRAANPTWASLHKDMQPSAPPTVHRQRPWRATMCGAGGRRGAAKH